MRGAALALLLLLSPPALAEVRGGAQAPDFTLKTLKGDTLQLSALRGKVVLLDFWASWCEPCQRELPELEKLQRELGARGLQVVALNLDQQRQNAQSAAQRLRLTLPVPLDPESKVAERYDPPKMPTSYLIDRAGVVRFIHAGYEGLKDVSRLRDELNQLLGR